MPEARTHAAAELLGIGRWLLWSAACVVLVGTFVFQVVRIDGRSMSPTLDDADRVVVNELVYAVSRPRPGDIVVLHFPPEPDRLFVKRLIATEGSIVAIEDGRVIVDGRVIDDGYVAFRDHGRWGPERIPPGYEFVLGDHRTRSYDSRDWGMVPKRYIVGKITLRCWPLDHIRTF